MKNKGFTLVELLVVISIISLLSSVVLGSLRTARDRAKDAAIKQDVQQMVRLMALNYDDYGSYSQLQSYWDYSVNDCNDSFSGNYAVKMREICKHIISTGSGGIHTGTEFGINTQFSILVHLPGSGQYYCAGSSGANSDKTPSVYAMWTGPGCYSNP